MSLSARHEAVLVDGRRYLLLGDRGWSSELKCVRMEDVPDELPLREHVSDIWATTSEEEIQATARTVVGPDEASEGRSQENMDSDHWAFLSEALRQHGVIVDAGKLRELPHDVVLSDRLLARLRRCASDTIVPTDR
jgi:hypothetical protein